MNPIDIPGNTEEDEEEEKSTSDLKKKKKGTAVVTQPGVCRDGVSARTGWPGVSIL